MTDVSLYINDECHKQNNKCESYMIKYKKIY